MADRFEDLRTFVTVVQSRSFAGAAQRMGIAKSAVSRRIQELEDRLGSQLLHRTSRSFGLTEAGRAFFERASGLLAELEDVEASAAHNTTLRISAPSAFGNLHLVAAVRGFLDRHERLAIEMELDDRMVDIVAEGFDLAVRIGELQVSNLAARPLAQVRRIACASPDYLRRHGEPRTPQELARHHGVAYMNTDPAAYWRLIHRGTQEIASIPAATRMRLNNGEALLQAAISGVGIAVLPTFIVHRAVAAGQLVRVLAPYEGRTTAIHAVYPTRRNMPAKVRSFVDYLVEAFGGGAYWDRDVFG